MILKKPCQIGGAYESRNNIKHMGISYLCNEWTCRIWNCLSNYVPDDVKSDKKEKKSILWLRQVGFTRIENFSLLV